MDYLFIKLIITNKSFKKPIFTKIKVFIEYLKLVKI